MPIPKATLERLPRYLNFLRLKNGPEYESVSSATIAQEMNLADAFINPGTRVSFPVRVVRGDKADIIGQYVEFSQTVTRYCTEYGYTREAAVRAIAECKAKGVLYDYLSGKEGEVVDMMVTLFSEEEARMALEADLAEEFAAARTKGKDEGMAAGMAAGRAAGMAAGQFTALDRLVTSGVITVGQAAESLGVSVDEYQRDLQKVLEEARQATESPEADPLSA